MPVYQGANSCYAMREGIYVRRVRRRGIDTVREAAAILYLILRDLRRGWTYDEETCRKRKMTRELFEKRVVFLIALSRFHRAPREAREAIRRLAEYVRRHHRLPRYIRVGSKRIAIESVIEEMIVRKR